MFSETFDIEEAADRIHRLSFYLFTERFQEGVEALNCRLGVRLTPVHKKKATYRRPVPTSGLRRLRFMMEAEYRLMEKIQPTIRVSMK